MDLWVFEHHHTVSVRIKEHNCHGEPEGKGLHKFMFRNQKSLAVIRSERGEIRVQPIPPRVVFILPLASQVRETSDGVVLYAFTLKQSGTIIETELSVQWDSNDERYYIDDGAIF